MASKAAAFIFLLLIFLCNTAFAHWRASGFDFIKNLQGFSKGEKVQGIEELKRYLERFGYLNYYESKPPSDDFDEQLESAIITYQINFNLVPTGILDPETVSEMMKPRCGVPDIINGKTRMKSMGTNNISRSEFYDGKPKWGKYHLT
ncbi:Metalloendoproteinase 5-MMP [Euphorbia peplus]|nr:Metalloendoproteinase 5-MMP [Euphorbia peplus]